MNLGDLKVIVVEARGLEVADLISGSSDPYIILKLGFQVGKTTIKYTTLNPIWKEAFTFNKLPKENTLIVEGFDHDTIGSDELIGKSTVNLKDLKVNKVDDRWYDFDKEKGKEEGQGKFRLILELLQHAPPNFAQLKSGVDKKIKAKEIEIRANENMIEAMEKPFAMFEVEKLEK